MVSSDASNFLPPLPSIPSQESSQSFKRCTSSLHRASLSSLPDELLSLIAYHLPRPSAVSFGLVARRFTQISERGIWRELPLSLPPDFVPVVAAPEHAGADSSQLRQDEARRTEDGHRECLRRKVMGILMATNARRVSMVKKVVMVPRKGSIAGQVTLLGMVSPHLRVLELNAGIRGKSLSRAYWRLEDHETFDVKIAEYPLFFPHLTHISFNHCSIRVPEAAILLVAYAPNLIALRVDIPQRSTSEFSVECEYPDIPAVTKLRRLELILCDVKKLGELCVNPLVALLDHSPDLEQLALEYLDEEDDQGYDRWPDILPSIAQVPHLRDLQLDLEPGDLCDRLNEAERNDGWFPSVRRLVLDSFERLDMFLPYPCLPMLEVIHLVRWDAGTADSPITTRLRSPAVPLSMTPSFTDCLSNNPFLRDIYHFPKSQCREPDVFVIADRVERTEQPVGIIRSLKHGNEELLHARFFSAYTEVEDRACSEQGYDTLCSLLYDAADGSKREKLFKSQPDGEGVWQYVELFQGLEVPLSVITQMCGAGGTVWTWGDRRGVEVGEEPWAVLRAWRNAQVRAAEAGIETKDPKEAAAHGKA